MTSQSKAPTPTAHTSAPLDAVTLVSYAYEAAANASDAYWAARGCLDGSGMKHDIKLRLLATLRRTDEQACKTLGECCRRYGVTERQARKAYLERL